MTEYVSVLRSDVEHLAAFFGECRLDHDGYCQEHTLSQDCFMPRFRAALNDGSEGAS